MNVEFFKHNIAREDIKNVEKVLKSPFLTTGAVVAEFEKKFAERFGQNMHARGVTNCTSALHLALLSLGICKGDEVITTVMSYIATAHAIAYTGAKPVFVDVDPETALMDLNLVEKAITKRTKAIIPVHLYGQMIDMKTLARIAKKHKLAIIEDAAHALEAKRDGVQPGELSYAACFSFYTTKSITSGEGGILLTRHKKLTDWMSMARLHGVSKAPALRHGKLYRHYDVSLLGFKCNMNNIQAALLLGQLERANAMWKQRRKIARQYEKSFSKTGIMFPKTEPGVTHAHHLFTILVDPKKRDKILHKLQKRGIGIAINYRPIHLMEYYRKTYNFKKGDFPHAEKIGVSTISLPLYAKLTNKEVLSVIKQVKIVIS